MLGVIVAGGVLQWPIHEAKAGGRRAISEREPSEERAAHASDAGHEETVSVDAVLAPGSLKPLFWTARVAASSVGAESCALGPLLCRARRRLRLAAVVGDRGRGRWFPHAALAPSGACLP